MIPIAHLLRDLRAVKLAFVNDVLALETRRAGCRLSLPG
jgi:hypothetical protein